MSSEQNFLLEEKNYSQGILTVFRFCFFDESSNFNIHDITIYITFIIVYTVYIIHYCFFWVLLSILFLLWFWNLETSSRPFYDF